jgi:inositol-phosphate phosphatase/L-galactose 1-phosphate phosphatase
VSPTEQLSKALAATELGTRRDDAFLDACFDRIRRLGQQTRSLRCTGSCALNLCSVAMGRCGQPGYGFVGGRMAVPARLLVHAGGSIAKRRHQLLISPCIVLAGWMSTMRSVWEAAGTCVLLC